jgi:hypothetical protein
MAAITNIRVYPKTGPRNALVVFAAGSQDQGGTIRTSPADGNIAAGDPDKLNDGQTYRLQYTSAGNDFDTQKKLELEFGEADYYFVVP